MEVPSAPDSVEFSHVYHVFRSDVIHKLTYLAFTLINTSFIYSQLSSVWIKIFAIGFLLTRKAIEDTRNELLLRCVYVKLSWLGSSEKQAYEQDLFFFIVTVFVKGSWKQMKIPNSIIIRTAYITVYWRVNNPRMQR